MNNYPTSPPPSTPPPSAPPTIGTDTTDFDSDPTWVLPSPPNDEPPPAFGSREDEGPSRRRRFAAGVVAAALIVGAGAGVGGAAAYDTWIAEDPTPANTPTSATTSEVVDSEPAEPAPAGSVQAVAEEVLPSVVKLDVAGAAGQGSGSGVIVSSDGEILTNDHVIEIADGNGGEISVSFNDGTKAAAEIVGRDPLTDTALIKAEDVSGLQPIDLGVSADLAVGQEVIAVGSPFGLDQTVTSGIVSALNRPVAVGSDGQGNPTTYPAIQTDAAINPGNSGGALVTTDGSLVGINSSIRSTSSVGGEAGSIGLGFAIPIDDITPILEQMRTGEEVTHARLGVTVSNVENATSANVIEGAQVQEVTEGSAADEAGLKAGDVITALDGQRIASADGAVATVRSYRPGEEVTVTYVRDGEENTATLELGSDEGIDDEPTAPEEQQESPFGGRGGDGNPFGGNPFGQ